jgi:F-type H+-transporting ATPase subunit a
VGTIVVPAPITADDQIEEKTLESNIQITEKAIIETKLDEYGNVLPVTEEQPLIEKTEVSEVVPAAEEKNSETVPLFRPGTADLNTTIALGIISVFAVQLFGFNALQFSYFKKFFNFSSPIMFYVGILELISEFAKVLSFAFRLFGNVFAGEVLLVVLTSLTKVVGPIPFYGLEVFVGFIQALVFAMLSLVLFNMATMSHDEH